MENALLITAASSGNPSLRPSAYELLFDQIEEVTNLRLCKTDKAIFQSVFHFKMLRKRQYLLQQGDICNSLAFVVQGALRMFSTNGRGHEAIIIFAVERDWLADRESMINQGASDYNIDAIEDCVLLTITYQALEALRNSNPAFAAFFRCQIKAFAIATQQRIHRALNLTIEEQYHDLLETNPAFGQRFSQNMLASYLGVQPETLSRIRKFIPDKIQA
ncbi:MAG: Crp/Fnr family transcriptional regulator [Mucilaginibacter sp.]|nr:Crp/Fnr family transcriptional regulator [Mucilaginibacter sp.]